MDSVLMAAAQAVALDSPYDSVFGPLVDDLVDALAGDDPAVFLTTVEGQARLLAAERTLRMADVFAAIQLGMRAFRGALAGASPEEALAAERVERLEGEALLRAGVGFAEGLEETVDHLSQAVVALSPNDPLTGLMKAEAIERQLAVELERCRRMEMGVGTFLLAVDPGEGARRRAKDDIDEVVRRSARLVGGSLRRYDAVGRLAGSEFLAVLPDVSRHGVEAVVDRLRRDLASDLPSGTHASFHFALAHLDYVDVGPAELVELLWSGMEHARTGSEPVVWV
jgi:diguanylate cyclase (GGDEF)-like protein